MKKALFYNLTKGYLSLEQVVQEIIRYVQEAPQENYDVIVGCDSSSEETPVFPVVIVARRLGQGGRFFVRKIRFPDEQKFYNLHSRILQEVYLSCQVALDLKEKLFPSLEANHLQSQCQFRYIHADIGGDKATQVMIKEVVNLIKSNGFEAKVKPESYAASSIADRFT